MSKATNHLSKDSIMADLISKFPHIEQEWKQNQKENRDIFTSIARTIVGQQLSVKAAATIWSRVENLVGDMNYINVLKHSREEYRAVGMSYSKSDYLISLANDVKNKNIDLSNLINLSNEEVESELIKLKGIGPWSAEMIMMFTLHRPDVFSIGDMGLKNAMAKLYKVDKNESEKIINISKKWSPYRTLACLYLWESLDNVLK